MDPVPSGNSVAHSRDLAHHHADVRTLDPSMFRVLVRPHAHPAPCAVAGSGPDGECMGAVEIGQEPRSHRAMASRCHRLQHRHQSPLHADVCPGHPHQFHAHYCLRHGAFAHPPSRDLPGRAPTLKHVQAAQVQPSRPWTLGWGMVAAIACLLALESPYFFTRLGLRWADAEDRSVQLKGIRLLRTLGHEETMLTACYQRPRRVFDLSSWLTNSKEPVTQEDARAIYYRVTGRPFNAVKPPELYTSQGRWSLVEDEFTWELDNALGGSSVAGRVMGLEMIRSRIDSRIETHGATSYTEWTMEFENKASLAREARAQIRLPAGGVVSRLTLWVNDEEREAAFASRNLTRKAYQKIAVERRRDPVLVTTSGPDQILMQCFPVPPDGGRMQIRFGITAPLDMSDLSHGRTRLPVMVERNFNLRGALKHAIWVESVPSSHPITRVSRPVCTTMAITFLKGNWPTPS